MLDREISGGEEKELYMGGPGSPSKPDACIFTSGFTGVFPVSFSSPASQGSHTLFWGHGLGRGK